MVHAGSGEQRLNRTTHKDSRVVDAGQRLPGGDLVGGKEQFFHLVCIQCPVVDAQLVEKSLKIVVDETFAHANGKLALVENIDSFVARRSSFGYQFAVDVEKRFLPPSDRHHVVPTAKWQPLGYRPADGVAFIEVHIDGRGGGIEADGEVIRGVAFISFGNDGHALRGKIGHAEIKTNRKVNRGKGFFDAIAKNKKEVIRPVESQRLSPHATAANGVAIDEGQYRWVARFIYHFAGISVKRKMGHQPIVDLG